MNKKDFNDLAKSVALRYFYSNLLENTDFVELVDFELIDDPNEDFVSSIIDTIGDRVEEFDALCDLHLIKWVEYLCAEGFGYVTEDGSVFRAYTQNEIKEILENVS